MSFYEFEEDDKIHVAIQTYPRYTLEKNGDATTGSVYLDNPYLNDDLTNRTYYGYSEKLGGFTNKTGPLTSSIEFITATKGGTNNVYYSAIRNLADYYDLVNSDYNLNFTGSESTTLRIINIPEIYYDRQIVSASFTASAKDSNGDDRFLYDNGRGGIYSGSLTGTIVGNIYYSEGLVVLKESSLSNFGDDSSTNTKYKINFEGSHKIPSVVFKCRAPGGDLLGSTNTSYYKVNENINSEYHQEREIHTDTPETYITAIGLYNENYELVGYAKLAQPIRKRAEDNFLYRLRLDF